MTDNQILQLLLDTQEWQTFECKRAAVQPHKLLSIFDPVKKRRPLLFSEWLKINR
ncbi:MAG: hypothetical protein UT11_C0011G0003 [Berkelbacteria bacterium GW2011_GWA2_38_9]|uniref:Uncharacterized protein n=1 Tax=Berkelbacteria bacterium GW2011_GWA2_38_9 TaxID=1618334 RepID=A0A0G0PLM9_9BACT|nr:MAG: hypothetical protein UT11_C0011G0003 [Berkelbacteria bacterium GW2011_GWA2_38_9]